MTRKENVAGLVSTTSAAVSVSFSLAAVSMCPTMYLAAANGVTVESAARTQSRPPAEQRCQ
jgi:hypothetical protein